MRILSLNVYDGVFFAKGTRLSELFDLAAPYDVVCIQDLWSQEAVLATARSKQWKTKANPMAGLAILCRMPPTEYFQYTFKSKRPMTAQGVLGCLVDGVYVYNTATTAPFWSVCGSSDIESQQWAELWTHVDATAITARPKIVVGDVYCDVENSLVTKAECDPAIAIVVNGKARAAAIASPGSSTTRPPVEVSLVKE